jgi:protein-disulfide isomerase
MQHRFLTFFVLGILSIMVFIFFGLRNRPIEIDYDRIDEINREVNEPTVTFINPSKGSKEATITIITYSDFTCGPCKTLSSTLQTILSTYPNDIRVVWKNLPNESLDEISTPSAMAAHCADRQGAFWEYHDELFIRQSYLSENQLFQIATSLGLNEQKFQSCYEKQDTLPIIKQDYEEGIALGITATPTIFIGDEIFIGAVSANQLIEVIENILARTP